MLKGFISLALILAFGASVLAGTESCQGGQGCNMAGMQMMECCRAAKGNTGEAKSASASPCCVINNQQPATLPTIALQVSAHGAAAGANCAVSHFPAAQTQSFEHDYLRNAYSPNLQSVYLQHLSLLI
jgi:hypothetical protein